MKTTTLILIVLVFSAFLAGCTSSPSSGYASYNQPQGQQQNNQYVGGGCGVEQQVPYEAPVAAKDGAL